MCNWHCDITGFTPGIQELKPKQGIAVAAKPPEEIRVKEDVRFVMKRGVVFRDE